MSNILCILIISQTLNIGDIKQLERSCSNFFTLPFYLDKLKIANKFPILFSFRKAKSVHSVSDVL